ncbi:hypothetical protein C8R46DRAFT_1354176 [Mycena filopes]|nr:hypothetical protein C8R46DRAFT_1354176 [Mycena filopes]
MSHPPLRTKKSFSKLVQIPDRYKGEQTLLNRANEAITTTESELENEEDLELKNYTEARAKTFRRKHDGLQTRYDDMQTTASRTSDKKAASILKEDIRMHKRRAKALYEEYRTSSEESRLEREKAARQAGRPILNQPTWADPEDEYEEVNNAEWGRLGQVYDAQTEYAIHIQQLRLLLKLEEDPIVNLEGIACHTCTVNLKLPGCLEVFPPGHDMAGHPMPNQALIGRESIEERVLDYF